MPLELCFWPGEGDTTVTLARFWLTLHEQVLPPVRLLISLHYRHIHHSVNIHNGGVKKAVRLFSEVTGQEAIGINFEIQEIQFRNKKKLLYHECSNTGTGCLERLGDVQNLLGQGHEQGLDSMISRCPCQPPQLSGSVSRTFPSPGHRSVCS